MKFGVIFSVLGAGLIGCGITTDCPVAKGLCFYATFSCLALGVAYALKRPGILLKRAEGRFPLLSWLLYAPYHVHNHLFLEVFRRTSRKPRWTEIVANLWLGGRLRPGDEAKLAAANIQSVLDVAGEFAEAPWLRTRPHYLGLALLDTTAPSVAELTRGISFIREHLPAGSVYVHCAFGHSRSATFVIGFLVASGHSGTVDEALAFVQSKRPRVRLSPPQLAVLRSTFPTLPCQP